MTTTSIEWVLLPAEEETELSTATAGIQGAVALATNAAGTGYFAAWSHLEKGVAPQTKGRLFDSDGMPATDEFPLGPSSGFQVITASAALPDGRFVVAFTQEGDDSDARAFIVSADGSPIASLDVAVGAFDEERPDVTALEDGGYAFSWTRDLDANNKDIYVSTYNADGTLRHAPIAANVDADRSMDASIASLQSGGFVVAWHDVFAGESEVRFRLFDVAGIPLGTNDGLVIDTLGSVNRDIAVAGLPDGGFVVAYEDNSWGNGSDITLRVYNADGTPRTAALLANSPANGASTLGDQDRPSLAVVPEGYFVVGWRSFSVECIQAFSPFGTAVGHSVAIAAQVEEGEITALHDGVLAAAWDRIAPSGEQSVHTTAYALRRFITGDGSDELINGVDNKIGDVIHGLGGNDTIDGLDGADTIHGGAGDDTIIGGAGDDTAAFSASAANYLVRDFGKLILVSGPEGLDRLTGIERLQFSDGTMTVANDGNALFDALYYIGRNPDVFHAGIDPLAHFNSFGWQEDRDPNALFDVSGYLAVNPDVAAGGMNPLDHYHHLGWHEGRDPSANFDTTLYLIRNPDVAAAGVDPLEHYLAFGAAEGRQAYKAVGEIVSGFDAQYYLFHNPDVAAAGVDPLTHFDIFGWHEGRKANNWFDTAGYLAHYADVAAAGVNPLEHYAQFGWKEGRDPSAGFDTLGYLAANPDVAAAHVDPLEHYLMFGIYEGRQMVNDGIWH